MNDTSTSKTKLYAYRAVGGAAVVAALATGLPAIHSAFLASLDLLGLAAVGGVGVVLAKGLPYAMQVVENRVLRLQIAEAAANPIETRINIAKRAHTELDAAMAAQRQIEALINSNKRNINDFQAQYPEEDISEFKSSLGEMEQLHAAMADSIRANAAEIGQYEARTKMLTAKLQLALGVQDLAQAMNPHTVRKAYDKLFSETATRAIDEKFDVSRAALRQVMTQVEVAKLMEPGSSAPKLLNSSAATPIASLGLEAQTKVPR